LGDTDRWRPDIKCTSAVKIDVEIMEIITGNWGSMLQADLNISQRYEHWRLQ